MKRNTGLPQSIMLVTLGLALVESAMAAEYSAEPRVRITQEHDSNIRMTERDRLSAMGTAAEAALLLKRRTEVSSQELDLRLRSTHYNRSEFSSEDQYVRGAMRRVWERSSLSVLFNIDRDTTRDSEIIDTGVILGSDRRERYYIEPAWSYTLTERQLISFSGAAEATRYGNKRYVGYDYGHATLGWTWVSSERLSWFVQGTYSHYESKESRDLHFRSPYIPPLLFPFDFTQSYSTESKTHGAQVGGEYQWSEQLSLTVLAGRSRSRNHYDINDPQQVCPGFEGIGMPADYMGLIGLCGMRSSAGNTSLWNATLQWNGQRHQFLGSVLSQTQPSADGYLLESERVNVGWQYELTEKARLLVDGTWGRNKALENSPLQLGANRSDRDFMDARVRYQHRLTEQWFIEADYRYRYSDRKVTRGSAESSMIMVGVRFAPQGWRWSR